MWTNFNNKLSNFKSITLTELNATASYLKRIDRKFLLTIGQFNEIINNLKNDFYILEIWWKKVFSYDNIYMDSEDYFFYKQHQDKENPRTKVRTRLYVDSNLAFFEYKQKNNWITSKYRYNFPNNEHWKMTNWKKRFFEWVWQSMYPNWKNTPEISPSIRTKYKRITLVSKTWSERLTIDFDIKIFNLRDKENKVNSKEKEYTIGWREIDLKNLVVMESKSLNKNCKSTKIMKNYWLKQTSSCSKYSLWIIYSWLAEKYDTFKETMKEIEKIKNELIT